ncbi:hypothetical protein SAMD00079811_17980 [Scytonema sp. HK-05]|nr:hypothetical protein SAMD00079811_17980 [Scytonema sp. HK-05]
MSRNLYALLVGINNSPDLNHRLEQGKRTLIVPV